MSEIPGHQPEDINIINLTPEMMAFISKNAERNSPDSVVPKKIDPEVALKKARAVQEERQHRSEQALLFGERKGIRDALSTENGRQGVSFFVENFLKSQTFSNFAELQEKIMELDESGEATMYGLSEKPTIEDTVIVSVNIGGKKTLVAVDLRLNQSVPPYLAIGGITIVGNQ